jgi:hypothetical protein
MPSLADLARRFRPYFKFSAGPLAALDEPYSPCPWPWFYRAAGMVPFERALELADVRRGETSEDAIVLPDAVRRGPGYSALSSGEALHAHVTCIGAHKTINETASAHDLVNLEYWLLFGWDESSLVRGASLDSLHAGPGHSGDLTVVQLVWDGQSDRIVRVAFPIHGSGMQAFDLPPATPFTVATLRGVDHEGRDTSVEARSFTVGEKHAHQRDVERTLFFTRSERSLSFERDPETGEHCHLAIYLERGTHEPWPNPTGSVMAAPKHRGEGISLLPSTCHVLDPRVDAPFLYFGGTFGVPKALARQAAFRDDDPAMKGVSIARVGASPYRDIEPLAWPPTIERG